MKKSIFIYLSIFALLFSACTSKFEQENTNPYQISDESLKQDFNFIGAYFPSMLSNVLINSPGQQVAQNLCSDSWVRYLATPTPFVGGSNNTTYHMTWKNFYWNFTYRSVMAPARKVIEKADAGGYTVFSAWAKLIKILSASRLTTYHGPIIYSDYGTSNSIVNYDSEEDLYNLFFKQLDTIQSVFRNNQSFTGLKRFDASYNGDINKWMMLVNSLRLRLAIRLSKVKPELAKQQGEKAYADPAGLILTNDDNFNISLYGRQHPLSIMCFRWNDTRMSASMESILVGYKDPRIAKYFNPVASDDIATLCSDHPDMPYKGIRNGAFIVAKGDRTPFSTINNVFKTLSYQTYMAASEVHFLLAEAKLRGWNVGSESVQEHYEDGVKASFARWGAGGVDAYLADGTSTPIDYNDPKAQGDTNDFKSRIHITIKWEETATNEEKLERIITQKWIAGYPNSFEAWVDFRRTGYPKLPYNYKNDSNADDGIIAPDDFIKRINFVDEEYTNNPDGVAAAVQLLSNKKDEIGTRLWWDTGGPNF